MPRRRCAPPQEALRQALERGASDEEIKKLMDQLRAALDKFMQALAEQMRKNPQQLARPLDPNARAAAPAGSAQHARPAWSSWRAPAPGMPRSACSISCSQMLENLQMARPGQQMDRTATTT